MHTTMMRRKSMEPEGMTVKKWELPFSATESFRLLGLQLGYVWTFREHVTEARKKPRVRQAVSHKASYAKRGLKIES